MKTQVVLNSLTRNLVALAVVLAVAQGVTANAELVYGVSDQLGSVISFDSATPQNLITAYTITGLQSGEQVRGIDWVNGVLYGLGSSSRLYTINPGTGAATQVGAGQFSPILNGFDFGFNANASQIYVASDLGQNLTINPVTGAVTAGPDYTAGSSVDSIAYDHVSGGFYGITASTHNWLGLNPVTGVVTIIGPTGVNFQDRVGLDISPNTDTAYISATVGGQTEFYTVDKATGAFTLVGTVGTPGELTAGLDGIAVVTVPEPSTAAMFVVGGARLLFGLIRRRQ